MPLSTDVRLPKSHTPTFPDKCVLCHQTSPGSFVELSTRAIGWWTLAFWLPGKRFVARAPACEWCVGRIKAARRWALVITWGFGAGGILLAIYLLGSTRVPFRKWLALGIALAAMCPWFVWQTLFPPVIDLTAYQDSVDYEFRDRGYAEEFAALNGAITDSVPDEGGGE